MIHEDDLAYLAKTRARVFDLIAKALEEDTGCKSYEGAIDISLPNYFVKDGDTGAWSVTLHAYVIGPSRHYSYTGSTLSCCLDAMNADLTKWEKEGMA